jgi:hypothetical protein
LQGQGQSLAGALDGLLVPPAIGKSVQPPPVEAGGYTGEQNDNSNTGHVGKDSKQTKDKGKDKGPQNGFTGGRPPRRPICTSIPGCQYCPYGSRCQECLFDGVAKFVRNGRGGCGELPGQVAAPPTRAAVLHALQWDPSNGVYLLGFCYMYGSAARPSCTCRVCFKAGSMVAGECKRVTMTTLAATSLLAAAAAARCWMGEVVQQTA